MMQRNQLYTLILALCMSLGQVVAQQGKLFIIGGGERSEALIEDLVKTADMKEQDYIVILPMATSVPEESVAYISEQLSKHTKHKAVSFNFSKEEADNRSQWIDSVKNARLIYITGGDQNKFMAIVRQTKLFDAIQSAYHNGATVSGTSAGAAVMSAVMITGGQKPDGKADSFKEVKADYVEVASGLGLLQHVIIDQHFIMRSRYNRLLSVLSDYPQHAVIGIDEGTALVVQGKNARISGVSQVVHIAQPKNTKVTASGKVSFEKANLSLYTHGQRFKLK